MLVRRMRAGDRLIIGKTLVHVQRSTESVLTVAIEAPPEIVIDHVRARPRKYEQE